ncbi:glycosyltransferase family A protein [Ammoniphilus sp. YIM 78166]|uniref:glycosyltransferase family 2 protein n=1 Tax=Ammoniphilus sp. YIM 78166 TaxID=1644106 RepID=UPI00196B658E|nr:glycosyltransferase family A protein [Ammoniphilus sp. YIM 78166]
MIIPTYNRGKFITNAIESVLRQTYRDLEIVIIDDGSTDDTRSRVAPYGSPVRYIYQQNQGVSEARNNGIKQARGKYIAFLDSDDLFLPHKLEEQMNYIKNHPECKFLYSWYYKTNAKGEIKLLRKNVACRNQEHLQYCLITRRLGIRTSTVLIHKECFEKAGLFNRNYWRSQDWDMWLRLAAYYSGACIKKPLAKYVLHDSNVSYVGGGFRNEIKKAALKLYGWDQGKLEELGKKYGADRDRKKTY